MKGCGWKLWSRDCMALGLFGLTRVLALSLRVSSLFFPSFPSLISSLSQSICLFVSLLVVSWILATLSLSQYLSFANTCTLRHYALSFLLVFTSSQYLPLDLFSIRESVLFILCIGCGGILLIAHHRVSLYFRKGSWTKNKYPQLRSALRFKWENIREKVDKSVAAGEQNAQACPKEKYKSQRKWNFLLTYISENNCTLFVSLICI